MSGFEVFEDAAGGWRFRLRARNGEIVATGEAYTREVDAQRGVQAVLAAAGAPAPEPELEPVEGEGPPELWWSERLADRYGRPLGGLLYRHDDGHVAPVLFHGMFDARTDQLPDDAQPLKRRGRQS